MEDGHGKCIRNCSFIPEKQPKLLILVMNIYSLNNLTKEEQKKLLEAELKELEAEKQEIEKKLNNWKNERRMPRPRLCRWVGFQPNITYFKPVGIRIVELQESILTVDEFEAVRLKDLLGLEQKVAAEKMAISQPTFHRLVSSARKKIADAIVNGKAIKIEGGNFEMVDVLKRKFKCYDCGSEWELPYGTGKPEECPKCKSKNIHRHPEDRGPQRGRGPRLGRA